MKTPLIICILSGLSLLFHLPVAGQDLSPDKRGIVRLINWPMEAYDESKVDSLLDAAEILPVIDTLTLGYSYDVVEQRPYFTYMFEWKPAGPVYIDGQRTPIDGLDGDVYIESIVMEADVLVDGVPATSIRLRHDSLMSESFPGLVTVEMQNLAWADVFEDTDANTAKSYFLKGFQLANLQIAAISFVFFEDEATIAESDPEFGRPRRPIRRTIYKPGVSIWIDFPVYVRRPPPRVAVVRDDDRITQPRGDRVGRGSDIDEDRDNSDRRDADRREDRDADEEDKSGGLEDLFSGKKKKDDDDEEDEGELLPAAVAGAAAVVAVAFIGGTVGYYGNTREAPIGLMTGYVQPEGGVMLQVAVNEALLQKSKTSEEHLIARVVSFVNAFKAPIQPALGLGVHVSQANNEVEYTFSVSPGLAGNFGPLVLLGGYDITSGGVDIGMAYNFRARR